VVLYASVPGAGSRLQGYSILTTAFVSILLEAGLTSIVLNLYSIVYSIVEGINIFKCAAIY
jgi:hypothetical protein